MHEGLHIERGFVKAPSAIPWGMDALYWDHTKQAKEEHGIQSGFDHRMFVGDRLGDGRTPSEKRPDRVRDGPQRRGDRAAKYV